MKRVLMLASVASMIDQFNMPNIALLQEMGYQVDVACNFKDGSTCSEETIRRLRDTLKSSGVRCYQIDFARDITNLGKNIKALWQTQRLMEENSYVFVHCHSPIGGVVARIAGARTGTRVLYTAHGFHFFKGAPLKNWLIYFPVEWLCSFLTDTLITINTEDYAFAKRHMHAKHVEYIPGVGVDLEKFAGASGTSGASREISAAMDAEQATDAESGTGSDTDGCAGDNSNAKPCGTIKDERTRIREELSIPQDAFVMLSVGELNENKNHAAVIRALSRFPRAVRVLDVYYVLVGIGDLHDALKAQAASCDLGDRIRFTGFRNDIAAIYQASDLFVFPSFREGLSVSLMESMASGLPVVCSRIRGNVDLIDEDGGFLFDPHQDAELEAALRAAMLEHAKNLKAIRSFDRSEICAAMRKPDNAGSKAATLNQMGYHNRDKIRNFSQEKVRERISRIYGRYLNEEHNPDGSSHSAGLENPRTGIRDDLRAEKNNSGIDSVIADDDGKNRESAVDRKKEPYTIFHVLNTGSFSGAENVIITMIRGFRRLDDASYRFIYVSREGSIRNILKQEKIAFEPVKDLSVSEIRRLMKMYHPDLIHAHDFTAGVICALAAGRTPVISHIHNNSPWIKTYCLNSVAYGLSCFRYRYMLGVSDSVFDEFVFGKYFRDKEKVIGNPFSADTIRQKAEAAQDKSAYDIVFLGRYTPQKNPQLFLQIVKQVAKTMPVSAVMIGDGELKDEVDCAIEKMNLQSVVDRRDFMENPYGILSASRVLCIPSAWEGFGLSAAEALSLGKPVVSSGAGGLVDIVDENCGLNCSTQTQYVQEIMRLLQDQEYYMKKSEGAYAKASSLDNLDGYVRNMKDIYDASL